MLTWYTDSDTGIWFSIKPEVEMLYSAPFLSQDENKKIIIKPFISLKDIEVCLADYTNFKEYNFKIPKNYRWDGASIPCFFWRLIGAKTDPRFLIPSLVHDVLCENHDYIDSDRYFSTRVFERLLYVSGVNAPKRWLMFHSTDNYQKFCSW